MRYADGVRIPLLRVTVDMWAAWIWEPEQTRDFVEALPCRVVKCRADHINMPCDIFDMQQRRVAAGNNQCERIRRECTELQLRDRDMSDDVIDAVYRLVRRPCKRFGP